MKHNTVVFSNQKGGVGKTTLSRELGIYLSSRGKTVLLVDADSQANLTKSLLRNWEEIEIGLYEALTDEVFTVEEVKDRLHLLPGSIKLASLEKSLIGEIDGYTRLRDFLENGPFSHFDYILIDSPPSLGVLTVNALTASGHLVIPMNPSVYSMQGTNDLMATVAKVRKNLNRDLALLGIIINAFDSIPVITRQIREEIDEAFGERVFSTALSKSIKIEEAIAGRKGIISSSKAKVKGELEQIGEEFLQRLRGV